MLPDPTSKYVSSTYFIIEFSSWVAWRSEAATTYEGGPTTDPCIMLALFHHSNFYLYSILFTSPASIYTVFFSLVPLLFNKDSFITPASICIVLFILLQLLFMQYSFHYSSFYLYSILFITPPPFYAVLLSLIQLKLILLRYSFCQSSMYFSKELSFFNKSHFY